MKNGIKTLATWLILAIVFFALISALFNNTDKKMNYSELMAKINNGEVSKIEISSDKTKAYVTLKEDATAKTTNSVKDGRAGAEGGRPEQRRGGKAGI